MKFACEKDDLLNAVQTASRAVSNQATLPILNGLRLTATEDGSVAVAATDLEMTIGTAFKAGVDEPGTAVIPARLFGSLVSKLASGKVTVAISDSEATISAGRGRYDIKSMYAADFPKLPLDGEAEDAVSSFSVDAATLSQAFGQVTVAASPNDARQVLCGVFCEVEGKSVTLAATDSYRLATKTLTLAEDAASTSVVLPARTLEELARALKSAAGDVKVVITARMALFTVPIDLVNSTTIVTRFIEGEFPKFRTLIPDDLANKLTVDKYILVTTVKRVGLLAQGNLPLRFDLAAELAISAETIDVGEGSEIIDATYEGEPLRIAFNTEFLGDGLAVVPGKVVTIEANDGLKPAIIRGDADDSFLYLLMPVRLG